MSDGWEARGGPGSRYWYHPASGNITWTDPSPAPAHVKPSKQPPRKRSPSPSPATADPPVASSEPAPQHAVSDEQPKPSTELVRRTVLALTEAEDKERSLLHGANLSFFDRMHYARQIRLSPHDEGFRLYNSITDETIAMLSAEDAE